MGSAAERQRAEVALNAVRALIGTNPDVVGSGLTLLDQGEYAVRVIARRRLHSLPPRVHGVAVIQETGDAPRPWQS